MELLAVPNLRSTMLAAADGLSVGRHGVPQQRREQCYWAFLDGYFLVFRLGAPGRTFGSTTANLPAKKYYAFKRPRLGNHRECSRPLSFKLQLSSQPGSKEKVQAQQSCYPKEVGGNIDLGLNTTGPNSMFWSPPQRQWVSSRCSGF